MSEELSPLEALLDLSYEKNQLADLMMENLELIDLSAVPRQDKIDIENLVRSIRQERALNDARALAMAAHPSQGVMSI